MSGENGPDQDEVSRLSPVPPVPSGGGPLRRLADLVLVDVAPLRRHRDFRLLFLGRFVSDLGSTLTFVAVPYQTFQLTGSTLTVGLLSLAELVPILLVAFVGGALADAVDRRRMVRIAEVGAGLAAGLLLANALLDRPRLVIVFVAAAAGAGCYALLRPSLDAMIPRLVDREELPAASALGSFGVNVAMLAGPSLGGVLIATAGLPTVYGLDAATYAVSLVALTAMRPMAPPEQADRPSLRGVLEGVRYARSRPELMGTYSVDMVAMLFGMPEALFPAYAERLGGPGVLGLLFAMPAAGALAASLTSGWTKHVHRHGLAVIVAASCWGAGIVVFGLAGGLAVALVGLGLAGAADMISGIFRSTIWNQTIPDRLRGRLASIEMVSYTTGPLLGNVESGLAAAIAGIRASAVSGGVLCIVGVAVAAVALPAFRRYDAREAAQASRDREPLPQ